MHSAYLADENAIEIQKILIDGADSDISTIYADQIFTDQDDGMKGIVIRGFTITQKLEDGTDNVTYEYFAFTSI